MRRASAVLFILAVLSAGCPRREDPASATPSATSASAAPPRSAHGGAGEPSLHGPPVVLRLKGTGDGTNEVDVTVEIDVLGPMAVPATMKVIVPPGAAVTSGNANETIALSQRGTLERKLHVKSPTPINDRAPIEVVLEARDLDAGVGFHAERQWPPRAEMVVPPSSGPRPPTGRPPGPPPQPLPQCANDAHSCFGPRLAFAMHLTNTAFAAVRLPVSISAVPQ